MKKFIVTLLLFLSLSACASSNSGLKTESDYFGKLHSVGVVSENFTINLPENWESKPAVLELNPEQYLAAFGDTEKQFNIVLTKLGEASKLPTTEQYIMLLKENIFPAENAELAEEEIKIGFTKETRLGKVLSRAYKIESKEVNAVIYNFVNDGVLYEITGSALDAELLDEVAELIETARFN